MLLTNARVIDGTGARPDRACARCGSTAGRIVDVVTGEAPSSDGRLDLAGRTLMPGLVDAARPPVERHQPQPGLRPASGAQGRAAASARARLLRPGEDGARAAVGRSDVGARRRQLRRRGDRPARGGTAGDRGGPADPLVRADHLRDRSRAARSSRPCTARPTAPTTCVNAVREQLRRGADFVKLMATGARSVLAEDPEPAQMTAAELRRSWTRPTGSASASPRTSRVSRAAGWRSRKGSTRSSTAFRCIASRRCSTRWRGTESCSCRRSSTFHDLAERFTDAFAPALVEQAKRQLEEAYATLVAARSAGVTLAMGHDSGPPGDNAIELVRMVEGGLSPLEGIAAATRGLGSSARPARRRALVHGRRRRRSAGPRRRPGGRPARPARARSRSVWSSRGATSSPLDPPRWFRRRHDPRDAHRRPGVLAAVGRRRFGPTWPTCTRRPGAAAVRVRRMPHVRA